MATKCNTCGGLYNVANVAKLDYYHACPPLAIAELKPLVGVNIYFCPSLTASPTNIAIPGVGAVSVVNVGYVETMVIVNQYVVERANKRDENITLDGKGANAGIKSAGTGTTKI